MKKLMLLAAVMIAAASHGASVYWGCTKVYAGNETDRASGIAYFVTTEMAATTDWASLSGAKAFTDKLGSAYSFLPSSAGSYSIANTSPVSNADLGLTDGKSYTGYLLIFDTTTITDDSKYFVTSTQDFQALGGTSTQSIAFGSQKDASQAAAGWTTVSTPEPTSGLLLLLGMAGLALKRKRA